LTDNPRPMGAIGSPFGVYGWMKIRSYTQQPEDLFDYSPWFIRQRGTQWREVQVEEYRQHGNGFIAKLNIAATPEEAKTFAGAEIGIRRSSLPPVPEGTVYLSDLIGCKVTGLEGEMLGTVSRIWDYGASPVMEVSPSDHLARERKDNFLIPYVVGPIVKTVDLNAKMIEVEWGVDY